NLIVVVDREWKGEIANRLERIGQYHASRTILCAVEEGRETLDAVAVMRYESAPGGTLCVVHEQLQIDLGPRHLKRLDTIVDALSIRHQPDSEASALLLAGWLASRLNSQLGGFGDGDQSGRHGTARIDGQREVRVHLEPHDQESPGLVGVTVAWGEDYALSL